MQNSDLASEITKFLQDIMQLDKILNINYLSQKEIGLY